MEPPEINFSKQKFLFGTFRKFLLCHFCILQVRNILELVGKHRSDRDLVRSEGVEAVNETEQARTG